MLEMKNKGFSSEQQERITYPHNFHFSKKDDVENATLKGTTTIHKMKNLNGL